MVAFNDRREVVSLTGYDVDGSDDVDFGSVGVVNYARSACPETDSVLVRTDATGVFDEVVVGTIAPIACLVKILKSSQIDKLTMMLTLYAVKNGWHVSLQAAVMF